MWSSSIYIRVPLGNLKYNWAYSSVKVIAFRLWVYSAKVNVMQKKIFAETVGLVYFYFKCYLSSDISE